MSERRLTEISYIVLGMLEFMQPATPYDLKRMASLSTMSFWTVSPSQLYSECARLAKEGLLSEVREQTGRRKRIYSVTKAGIGALEAWRVDPGRAIIGELHDLGTLKLFLGADPVMLARSYLPEHEGRLRHYEALHDVSTSIEDTPRGALLALEAGIGHIREYVRFWRQLLAEGEEERRITTASSEQRGLGSQRDGGSSSSGEGNDTTDPGDLIGSAR
jgi:PadR family transcriptional regulator AphA